MRLLVCILVDHDTEEEAVFLLFLCLLSLRPLLMGWYYLYLGCFFLFQLMTYSEVYLLSDSGSSQAANED